MEELIIAKKKIAVHLGRCKQSKQSVEKVGRFLQGIDCLQSR